MKKLLKKNKETILNEKEQDILSKVVPSNTPKI